MANSRLSNQNFYLKFNNSTKILFKLCYFNFYKLEIVYVQISIQFFFQCVHMISKIYVWIFSSSTFEQRKKPNTAKRAITIDEKDKTKVFSIT